MGTEKAAICEHLRKNLVTAMQFGGTLAISLGHLPISFASKPLLPYDEKVESYRYNDATYFDADFVFDFEGLRNPDKYRKLIAKDENKTVAGGDGQYVMNEGFNMVILANYTTE